MLELQQSVPIVRRRFRKEVAIDASICVACARCVDVCAPGAMRMIPFERLTPERWQDWGLDRRVETDRQGYPATFIAGGGVALVVDESACNRCRSCEIACLTGACTLAKTRPQPETRLEA